MNPHKLTDSLTLKCLIQTGKQSFICKNEPDVVNKIREGAYMGTKECALQFSKRRWNCTSVRKSMKKVLERDTREAAFVHAITTAGVTYAVAQACSSGRLLECRFVSKRAKTERKSPIYAPLNVQYFHPICNTSQAVCVSLFHPLFGSFFLSFSSLSLSLSLSPSRFTCIHFIC